jgi:hypothetical protein
MGKSFELDVEDAPVVDEEDWWDFVLDGHKFFYIPPTQEQITIYTAAFDERKTDVNIASTTFDFLAGLLDVDSYAIYMENLANPEKRKFTVDGTFRLLERIFEEATNFPTSPSSGSMPSRRQTGSPSTDHLPPRGSTRVRSRQSGSATPSGSGAESA